MFDLTLSFDNGPSAVTPKVLDLLKQHGIKATFFVVGQQMADPVCRKHAQRAFAEGHWIGNHTYTHTYTFGQFEDLEASVAEVTRTQDVIGELVHPDRLIRPFADGGVYDERILNRRVFEYLKAERFTVVFSHACPKDFQFYDWVSRALEQCRERPWTLMVLHDLPGMAWPNLERFIPLAFEAGARFRQDFPQECVPLRKGELKIQIDHLIARKPVPRKAAPGQPDPSLSRR